MNLTKKRWIILLLTCLVSLCIGSLYAWSVFASPMAAHLTEATGKEYTGSSIVIAYTIANMIGPIFMISGGTINDKFGPRWVIFAGGILFGLGMIISSFANTLGVLILGYGIGCGFGNGLVYGTVLGNSVKFFPDKRGLIGGITTAAYGLGSVIMPPIANSIISSAGIISAFRYLGVAFIVIICIGALFIDKCPVGFMPEGWTPPASSIPAGVKTKDRNWKGMLSDKIFYVMFFMLTCGAVSGLMVISQASPIAQKMVGMPVAAATAAVSILALFNAAGRVVAGFISDKLGRINTLLVFYFVSLVGVILLFFCGEGKTLLFYVGVSVVGISFGAFTGVFPGFTADHFGSKNNSVNYGIMFIAFALAGLIGPSIMSSIYGSTGTYNSAFVVALALIVIGIVLSFVYRLIQKKRLAQ